MYPQNDNMGTYKTATETAESTQYFKPYTYELLARVRTIFKKMLGGLLKNLKVWRKKRMCKSMTDFEILVQTIQARKEEGEKIKKEIKEKEDELKAYMKKRQKEELLSKTTGLTISYKEVETPKFNKDLFIESNGEEAYKKYLVSSIAMRLNYLKPKKA